MAHALKHAVALRQICVRLQPAALSGIIRRGMSLLLGHNHTSGPGRGGGGGAPPSDVPIQAHPWGAPARLCCGRPHGRATGGRGALWPQRCTCLPQQALVSEPTAHRRFSRGPGRTGCPWREVCRGDVPAQLWLEQWTQGYCRSARRQPECVRRRTTSDPPAPCHSPPIRPSVVTNRHLWSDMTPCVTCSADACARPAFAICSADACARPAFARAPL